MRVSLRSFISSLLNVLATTILSSTVMAANGPEKMWTKNELKVLVEPGDRQCFYQFVETEAVFHSSYQVIKGDGISFEVIDPKGISLTSLTNEVSGSHQLQHAEARGDYAVCLDNTYSHMTSKLISLFILTFQSNLMQKKIVEDQMLNETHSAVRQSTNKLSLNIVEMITHQAMARFRNTRDEYVIESNNSLIAYWSCFQSFLIVLCGCFQVYFVKRLFLTSGSSSKGRLST